MENSNEIKISIPKPCHEDWNTMTPNEKGAFCGKCAKTVLDFTKKSTQEIKDVLLEQSGKKVCGRFLSNQLDEQPKPTININFPYYILPKNISYRKAFAIALFFAFGTSLFSCRTTDDHLVGDIAYIDSSHNQITGDTAKVIHLLGDTIYSEPENIIKGDVKAKPACKALQGDVQIERTLGEVMIQTDTIKNIPSDTLKMEPKMGKIKVYKGIDE